MLLMPVIRLMLHGSSASCLRAFLIRTSYLPHLDEKAAMSGWRAHPVIHGKDDSMVRGKCEAEFSRRVTQHSAWRVILKKNRMATSLGVCDPSVPVRFVP